MERASAVELRKRYAKELLRSQQKHRCSNVQAHAGREGPVEVCEIRMRRDPTHEVGVLVSGVTKDRYVRGGCPIRSATPSHMDLLDKGVPGVLRPFPGENKKRASFADRNLPLAAVSIFQFPAVQEGLVEGF